MHVVVEEGNRGMSKLVPLQGDGHIYHSGVFFLDWYPHRLAGLVVKACASGAEDLGFESRL